MLTETGEIRRDDSCLDYHGGVSDSIMNRRCHGARGNQEWRYEQNSGNIYHVNSNKCVTITQDKIKIIMSKCQLKSQRQIWNMHLNKKKAMSRTFIWQFYIFGWLNWMQWKKNKPKGLKVMKEDQRSIGLMVDGPDGQ